MTNKCTLIESEFTMCIVWPSPPVARQAWLLTLSMGELTKWPVLHFGDIFGVEFFCMAQQFLAPQIANKPGPINGKELI